MGGRERASSCGIMGRCNEFMARRYLTRPGYCNGWHGTNEHALLSDNNALLQHALQSILNDLRAGLQHSVDLTNSLHTPNSYMKLKGMAMR